MAVKLNAMRFRNLRIAWSVAWGMVAVLLTVIWVRSYWRMDILYRSTANSMSLQLASVYGHTFVKLVKLPGTQWSLKTSKIDGRRGFVADDGRGNAGPLPKLMRLDGIYVLYVPYWIPIAVFVFASAAPWLRFRFSLRTLLIATTIIAVVLGLIACASR